VPLVSNSAEATFTSVISFHLAKQKPVSVQGAKKNKVARPCDKYFTFPLVNHNPTSV